jgi:hypothetical protein
VSVSDRLVDAVSKAASFDLVFKSKTPRFNSIRPITIIINSVVLMA